LIRLKAIPRLRGPILTQMGFAGTTARLRRKDRKSKVKNL
jgi:hypothetical protein